MARNTAVHGPSVGIKSLIQRKNNCSFPGRALCSDMREKLWKIFSSLCISTKSKNIKKKRSNTENVQKYTK